MVVQSFRGFCGGTFWNNTLLLEGTWPQFTECFMHTVLIWIPVAFLWLMLPWYVTSVRKYATNVVFHHTALNGTRTFCSLALAFLSLLQLFLRINETSLPRSPAAFLGDALQLTSYILLAVMTQYERKKGAQQYGVPFFFWLLLTSCTFISFYTSIMEEKYKTDVGGFGILVLSFVLQLTILILTGFVDHGGIASKYQALDESPCPENTCSFPMYLFMWWMTSLMVTIYKRDVEFSDLWMLPSSEQSSDLAAQFEQLMQQEQRRCQILNRKVQSSVETRTDANGHLEMKGHSHSFTEKSGLLKRRRKHVIGDSQRQESPQMTNPSLARVLVKMFGKDFLMAYMLKVVSDLILLLIPLLLSVLIGYLEARPAGREWQGYVLSLAIFITLIIRTVLYNHSMMRAGRLGLRIKSALISAIYKKAFSLNNAAKNAVTTGEVVNLMAVDAYRLQDMMPFVFLAVSALFLIVVAVIFLYTILGPSVIVAIILIVSLIPLTLYVRKKQHVLQVDNLFFKDMRIRLFNEIFKGIKVLKLYAWEQPFREKIRDIRNKELANLSKLAIFKTLLNVVWVMASYLITLATFTAYILIDRANYLGTNAAFTSLSLFGIIRAPFYHISVAVGSLIQAYVSIERINRFLAAQELDPDAVIRDDTFESTIVIKDGSFTWDRDLKTVLSNINLTIGVGRLVAVVGAVGCGKSSLISAVIGEMEKITGKVITKGRVAYVPQQAWMTNATVRDNILFGAPYVQSKYRRVLSACELERDLAILSAGDMTEIGEKGINLSGGQKQRVSIARAVYSDSDLYLLDDPLSAVDSHVGKAIFNNVIANTGILKRKTRVFVTHGVHWLPRVDEIVVMDDGKITERGSYEELISHDGPFAQILQTYLTADNADDEDDDEIADIRSSMLKHLDSVTSADEAGLDGSVEKKRKDKNTEKKNSNQVDESEKSVNKSNENAKIRPAGALTTDEVVEKGKVSRSVLKDYWKAAGTSAMTLALLSYCTYCGFDLGANFWLKVWSGDPKLLNASIHDIYAFRTRNEFYLAIYGLMGVGQLIFLTVFYYLFWSRMVTAAHVLHARVTDRLFRAPMVFFDTTPTGRILNRVSSDIEIVDETLPKIVNDYLATLGVVLITLLVIMIQTPLAVFVLLPVILLYFLCQKFFVPTARQLKRMDCVTRSPIFALFCETLTGASSIKTYGVKDRFVGEAMLRVDRNSICYFLWWGAMRWVGICLDVLSGITLSSAALFSVISADTDPGVAGLSISCAIQLISWLTYLSLQASTFEANIVSLERLKEYSELATEAEWIVPDKRPPESWPEKGEITFSNYQTQYRQGLELVLKGLNFTIRHGEKVGVVGRTGAGKSSLAHSLFRLIESAGGAIYIDGVNIADIGLHDLRSHLAILPQDPVLFSGSLRMNLDPFDEYSDDQLWTALDMAHLKSAVTQLPGRLQCQCGEEGANFSVGQRQLVCLARTLLRICKILVLDEATAAVDMETDTLIQDTIRSAFSACTVITIAHRLNTIMDYDRILVLEAGLIKEFESPEKLLEDKTSHFYSMARDAGLV